MRNKKIVYKLFTAWQDDKEAAWLEGMALRGWILEDVQLFRYIFTKEEAGIIRYRLDYQELKKNELQEYIQLFHDSGWTMVARLNNWYYFATRDMDVVDIYTDRQSQIDKYRRVFRTLLFASFPLIYYLIFFSNFMRADMDIPLSGFLEVTRFVMFAVWVLFMISLVQIGLKIKKMEDERTGQ